MTVYRWVYTILEITSHPRIAHGQRYPMPCLEWLAAEVEWEQGSGPKGPMSCRTQGWFSIRSERAYTVWFFTFENFICFYCTALIIGQEHYTQRYNMDWKAMLRSRNLLQIMANFASTASTRINRPGYNTYILNKIFFGKTVIEVCSPYLYASFGTFFAQIEVCLKVDKSLSISEFFQMFKYSFCRE